MMEDILYDGGYVYDGGYIIIESQWYITKGDLNGKTKTEEDFVRDKYDKHSPITTSYYTKDCFPLSRQNMNQHTTGEQGKIILSRCKNSALRILNGRSPGELKGSLTR